jgi:putative effector of murein hydrolase
MNALFSLPITGIIITIGCYMIGLAIRKRISSPLTNPILIANVLTILIILYTPISLEQYMRGGNMITMFIGPVTVILALRIYRERAQLKANVVPILGGCIAGSAASLFSVWALSRLFKIDQVVMVSLLPKSVTTAIAQELSIKNGGQGGLTITAVIITGVFCSAFSPFFVKIFKLKDPVAAGVSMGASGHAIGTAAAIELGETQGAMSGLAMAIMGIVTSIIYVIFF